MKANEDIRDAIRINGIKQWQVADAYGVSEATFTRLLRVELPQSKKETILKIVSDLSAGKKSGIYKDNQQFTHISDEIKDSLSNSERFESRLRYLVAFNSITYANLASQIGISQQRLSSYVHGRVEPNLTILCKIADYFNVSIDYLLGREAK